MLEPLAAVISHIEQRKQQRDADKIETLWAEIGKSLDKSYSLLQQDFVNTAPRIDVETNVPVVVRKDHPNDQ